MSQSRPAAAAWAAGSAASLLGAVWIAAHHPLSPLGAVAATLAAFAIFWHWPGLWLFMLPAALPAVNLAPWTGWIVVDEFDLLVLVTVSAGYARLAVFSDAPWPKSIPRDKVLLALLWVLVCVGLWRGLADAGFASLGWYDGYGDAGNSLRASKSLFLALLLVPMLHRQCATDAPAAYRRFARGMLFGVGIVSLAALCERIAYPGLLNFSEPYRTTALFWEMHVGGAAIDGYVVLATPFVIWAVWQARPGWRWAAAALLAVVWLYVCLTTFSRGAYLGITAGGATLAFLLPWTKGRRWIVLARRAVLILFATALLWFGFNRGGYVGTVLAALALTTAPGWIRRWVAATGSGWPWAGPLLALALLFEIVVVAAGGSFLSERAERSGLDYASRITHWSRGMGLLQTPVEWVFGLGAGRLPANYDRFVLGGEVSGQAILRETGGGVRVELQGPRSMLKLSGLHGLTQRVPLESTYRVRLQARAERRTRVSVRVCESHLLYDRVCQAAFVAVPVAEGTASHLEFPLAGPPLTRGFWFAPRHAVMTVSVLDVGGRVELERVELLAKDGRTLSSNGDFSQGLAHWLPAAQYQFLPWHIDNLYLELLIERGVIGLSAFIALCALALLRMRVSLLEDGMPFLAASLVGILCLGLVSSVLDVPRIALVLWLVLAMSLRRASPAEHR